MTVDRFAKELIDPKNMNELISLQGFVTQFDTSALRRYRLEEISLMDENLGHDSQIEGGMLLLS